MNKDGMTMYINIYQSVSSRVLSVTRRIHESRQDADDASVSTCASKTRKRIARIRIEWKPGQFDE